MIRKIPLKSQNTAQNQFVYPSFILQFKDVPAKPHKEVSDDKLSGRVYQMINHSISQKVNGPLGAILNQTKIFQIMSHQFGQNIANLKGQLAIPDYRKVKDFFDTMVRSNNLYQLEGNNLLQNFEGLQCFTKIKSRKFLKNNALFDVR